MTKREAIRQTHQENTLMSLGFTQAETEALRRISLTLHRWSEHECNGAIQRDGDNGDGVPYWYNTNTGRKVCRVPDREAGAIKRLTAIVSARNTRLRVENAIGDVLGSLATDVQSYIQGDPRGCSLYILRPGDVPNGERADGYYSRGISVY